MVDISALRATLVKTLRYFYAIEPEDGAQIIMLRMHMIGGFDWPSAYLRTAAKNMAADQRQRSTPLPLIQDDHARDGVLGSPLWGDNSWVIGTEPDPFDALPLPDSDRDWLRAYCSDNKGREPKDRVRAHRLRAKLRRQT